MASPGDYQHFRGIVPERRIQVGMHQNKHFRYYEFGPKRLDPLVCLGGAASTADCFYKQVLALSAKGYRIMAVDSPALWTHAEWMAAFDKFLDSLRINQVHLYGTSLGGFLCQLYAAYRPRRVKSLILSNTFIDTKTFHDELTWSSLFQWTPEFMLKRIIMAGLGEGFREAHIANSIDFVVSQLETLHQQELASRLTLMSQLGAVGHLHLADDVVTIMDTNDYCNVKQDARDALYIRYPGARRAFLKSGGDFPFLSRADEVNLHLQLHLRRVGVEPDESAAPPSPSPTTRSSPPHKSLQPTTSGTDERLPSDAPPRSRSQSGDGDETEPDGQREPRPPWGDEPDSVGAHLAYKKDPLWAALADEEASVWTDGVGSAGREGTAAEETAEDGTSGERNGKRSAPQNDEVNDSSGASSDGPDVTKNGTHGEEKARGGVGQAGPAARASSLKESDDDVSDSDSEQEGWRKEGADPLLWGTAQGGEGERKEGAGDPLSASNSLDKDEGTDGLSRRRSGRG